jgi:hypothetical protein
MRDIIDVIKNIETLYSTNSSLSVLKDFERVIDELDLYVYENWIDGELADGPHVSRHWISASFMWPKESMPDPMGAKRLLDYGCKVKYEKTHVIVPKEVESPDDFRPGTKKGKLEHNPVWVVSITMPRKLVADMFNGYMSKMKDARGIDQANVAPAVATPAEQSAVSGTEGMTTNAA